MNDEDGLTRTLASLVGGAVEGVVRDVIVCDRGSTDQTHYVEEHAGCSYIATGGVAAGVRQAKGEWLLAVQFHPEVTDEIHEEWLREWGDELPEYGLSRERLREERASFGPLAEAASAQLLGEYLDGLGARDTRAA